MVDPFFAPSHQKLLVMLGLLAVRPIASYRPRKMAACNTDSRKESCRFAEKHAARRKGSVSENENVFVSDGGQVFAGFDYRFGRFGVRVEAEDC